MDTAIVIAALVALALSLPRLKARLELSLAKHRSLAGHSRIARFVTRLVPYYAYDEGTFFGVDGAPQKIVERRRAGFMRFAAEHQRRFAATIAATAQVENDISDLQFTNAYRVPFQFRRVVQQHLRTGSFLRSSSQVTVTDLDGNEFYDLSGSYGVNVFGYDFYKSCIERAVERAGQLGPVLGAYHPVVADNVRRLRAISGQDEVSFHMSGTEAVMQAVRLARYHTRRSHLVRFCGAYHGWWGDVQPGIGNPQAPRDTYTLKDMDERSLQVLRHRRDVACVLVNPVQAMHPNRNAPGDSALIDSSRHAHFDLAEYAAWLHKLRAVCSERNIVLIFDEVFVGFRLAPRGAQEYFGVSADLVTYGKTVAGGLPIGVVCGRKDLMRRFRDDRPTDVCFARGTFNAHPYVMAAMDEFLRRLETPEVLSLYDELDRRWNDRAAQLNARLREEGLPLAVANMSTIWTICYTVPSRYNWLLQYYLRSAGVALSWVGTGRLLFSLGHSDADFAALTEQIVAAARAMQQDGWWWEGKGLTNAAIRRRVFLEMFARGA